MGSFLSLLPIFSTLLDRILPDKQAADAAKLELMKMAQQGDLAQLNADTTLASGQLAINQVEAASTRLFVAGWRPFVGWICGLVLAFKYIGGPFLSMVFEAFGHPVALPNIPAEELWPVLLGLLGLSASRSVEKVKGAA